MTMQPVPTSTRSALGWLRRLFGGQPADGRLRPTVKAAQGLDLVRGGATLLDVRESSEWKSGHAPGAVHVALSNIDQADKRLRQDRRIVVMCASGVRSRSAARHLRSRGYDATSLSGGIGAWQRAGGAVGR